MILPIHEDQIQEWTPEQLVQQIKRDIEEQIKRNTPRFEDLYHGEDLADPPGC